MLQNRGPCENAGKILDDSLPSFGNNITAFILAGISIVSSLISEIPNIILWILFLIAIISFILTIVTTIFKRKQNKTLLENKTEIEQEFQRASREMRTLQENYYQVEEKRIKLLTKILKIQLQILSDELDFGSQDRITVYHHKDEQFNKVQRYSNNPILMQGGRPSYPIKGIIGEAWRKGEAFDNKIPIFEVNKEAEYYQYHKDKWDIDIGVAEKLTMKSSVIFGSRLSKDTEPVGIIIFESIVGNNINETIIKDKLKDSLVSIITFILNELKEPKKEYVKEEDLANEKVKGLTCLLN